MSLTEHFKLLATYNQWINAKMYDAAAHLSAEEQARNRGAFFGSILGTLNHIVVGDTIWLKRFATLSSSRASLHEVVDLPNPSSLNQILFEDLATLSEHRARLDSLTIRWVGELSEGDLDVVLSYRTTKGVPVSKRFSSLILHFFNHQTHHRGQVSTLLSQAGQDVGVTDLLLMIPEESHA